MPGNGLMEENIIRHAWDLNVSLRPNGLKPEVEAGHTGALRKNTAPTGMSFCEVRAMI
jgi:hypothetical protein